MSYYEPNAYYVAVAPEGDQLDYHVIDIPHKTLEEARQALKEEVAAERDYQIENYGSSIPLDAGILKTDEYGDFVEEYGR